MAALGYAALQIQTLGSTDEALIRTQSITLLHSATEKIRINAVDNVVNHTMARQRETSNLDSNNLVSNVTVSDMLAYYAKQFKKESSELTPLDCRIKACAPKDIAINDVIELNKQSATIGVSLGMSLCPGIKAQVGTAQTYGYCLIAAWNETNPTQGSKTQDCFESDAGEYAKNADCIYMETY